MTLHFYADEGGTHDPTGKLPGSEVAVVAGYVAAQEQWTTFCKKRRQALNENGLQSFHASDMLGPGPKGLCHYWSKRQIEAFVHRLIGITKEHTLFGIAADLPPFGGPVMMRLPPGVRALRLV